MLIKRRILFSFFFFLCIWLCFSQENKQNIMADYLSADKLYTDAEKLSSSPAFNDATELKQETLNRQALQIFKTIISKAGTGNDSILFHCYVKAGLLEHYFDSLPQARDFYLKALQLRSTLSNLEDSFFFKPNLFAGSVFYSQNVFDTARYYYKQAEQIAAKYNKPLEETERLYNRMGVMNYETGNYRLANNYFQQAINLLSTSNPSYQDLLINYKMNIASISINLEEYEKAAAIFSSIIPYNIHLNEIYHNLGIINLRMKKFSEGISFFRKVNYSNDAKNVDLYSNMAEAYAGLGLKDSSQFYINKAVVENQKTNGNRKNVSNGILLKLIANEKINDNDLAAGLSFYQQAICQFYPFYNNTDIHAVPEKYSGVFSYIPLFNTLILKADAFEKLYIQTKNIIDLESSFNAYRSAFELTDYVAKTYNSDEARIFLNKIKYTAHDKAIKNSLLLYEITSQKNYLEQAYLFDQQNKASALTLALQEINMQKEAAISQQVSSQQSSLRSAITRLSLKAAKVADSAALAILNNQISEDEINLSKIEEQINDDPSLARFQTVVKVPSIETLQKTLDDKTTLLSYHFSDTGLIIFSINKNTVDYTRQHIDSSFLNNVRSFASSLHAVDESQRYNGTPVAKTLYRMLVKPALSRIGNSNRLLIIPDDELNYIAFEALQDEEEKYLVQSFTIQYQYSTALLQLKEIKNSNSGILAFAPFTGNTKGIFTSLPYSKEEVSGLKGNIFLDADATKQHFIEQANKYATLQLATHAVANDTMPQKSFIAFYPGQQDSTDENILYAQEIYNLRLDSTKLIILSACETGNGKLIRGEGLMSISRAFAYAGCPNIITSLWKASDKTTAFITKRLHFYLDQGNSRDVSLQLAKLDLLNNNEISPSLKTPNYWAHLVLIGNYEAKKSFRWYLFAEGFILFAFIILLIKKLSRRKTGQQVGYS
jgi:CHAT domain-containing protein